MSIEHENLLKTVQEIYENRAILHGRSFAVIGEITKATETGAYIIDPGAADSNIRIFVDFSYAKDLKIPPTGTEI